MLKNFLKNIFWRMSDPQARAKEQAEKFLKKALEGDESAAWQNMWGLANFMADADLSYEPYAEDIYNIALKQCAGEQNTNTVCVCCLMLRNVFLAAPLDRFKEVLGYYEDVGKNPNISLRARGVSVRLLENVCNDLRAAFSKGCVPVQYYHIQQSAYRIREVDGYVEVPDHLLNMENELRLN
ncbi:MAG: hypothetical protein KDJ35_09420 [Alphaproteobacteria bacterium]|nr:hypothetical protein [Alphaproteobacteria bacterium]